MVLPSFYDKKSYSLSCLANVQFILQMILSDPHKALIIYWLFFTNNKPVVYYFEFGKYCHTNNIKKTQLF